MPPVTLLTTAEAAFTYRISVSTVKRWIRSGKLPSIRIGRKFLVPHDPDALAKALTSASKGGAE